MSRIANKKTLIKRIIILKLKSISVGLAIIQTPNKPVKAAKYLYQGIFSEKKIGFNNKTKIGIVKLKIVVMKTGTSVNPYIQIDILMYKHRALKTCIFMLEVYTILKPLNKIIGIKDAVAKRNRKKVTWLVGKLPAKYLDNTSTETPATILKQNQVIPLI
jgi:hypothetical protein